MVLTLLEERLIDAWASGNLGGQPQAIELARIAGRLKAELAQARDRMEKLERVRVAADAMHREPTLEGLHWNAMLARGNEETDERTYGIALYNDAQCLLDLREAVRELQELSLVQCVKH